MIRDIVDVPRLFWRAAAIDWRIDWRGQSAGGDLAGGEQIVYNAAPRIVGSPTLVLPRRMIGSWRALMARRQGRVNAIRARLVDPALPRIGGGTAGDDWEAWLAGQYVEPRPQIPAVAAAAAGDSTLVVDERLAPFPVQVGAFLSYGDWPFLVTSRSGSGATVTLEVALLRTAIAEGASIDLLARGLFVGTADEDGSPAYGADRIARPQLDLVEWVTR